MQLDPPQEGFVPAVLMLPQASPLDTDKLMPF